MCQASCRHSTCTPAAPAASMISRTRAWIACRRAGRCGWKGRSVWGLGKCGRRGRAKLHEAGLGCTPVLQSTLRCAAPRASPACPPRAVLLAGGSSQPTPLALHSCAHLALLGIGRSSGRVDGVLNQPYPHHARRPQLLRRRSKPVGLQGGAGTAQAGTMVVPLRWRPTQPRRWIKTEPAGQFRVGTSI